MPGNLTIPDEPGPRSGVVLLAGGGPFDSDETSGPNKPLKDLAWGLASHGIAVARFDKVTHTHHQVATAPDFTMTAEYVPHAARVDSPDLSPSTPAAELPLGLPAAYWLDLRDYDPVGAAAALEKPMLILQGGRDYQVTVADELARWKAGLAHRTDVAIHVHDADNHLFFPGTGPSTPAEYEQPQHVDPAVITDITTWLTTSHAIKIP